MWGFSERAQHVFGPGARARGPSLYGDVSERANRKRLLRSLLEGRKAQRRMMVASHAGGSVSPNCEVEGCGDGNRSNHPNHNQTIGLSVKIRNQIGLKSQNPLVARGRRSGKFV
ncbi:hypothetical protein ACSQ67_008416 [Phaseolus vulgaris]